MRKRLLLPAMALALLLVGATILWAQGKHREAGMAGNASCPMHAQGAAMPAGCPMQATGTTAAPAPAGEMCAGCPLMGDLTTTLHLTTEQTPQVKAIQEKARQAVTTQCQAEVKAEQAITAELQAAKPDAKKLKALVAEAGKAQTACRQAMVDSLVALKSVLTADQWKALPACPMLAGSAGACPMHEGKAQGESCPMHQGAAAPATAPAQTEHDCCGGM